MNRFLWSLLAASPLVTPAFGNELAAEPLALPYTPMFRPTLARSWYRWDDGLVIERGQLNLRARFRFHYDWVFNPEGSDVRRQRIILFGRLADDIDTRWEWDTEDFDGDLLDAWFNFRQWEDFQVRVGKFWEPIGLEAQTNGNDLTFLERAAPLDALTPGRSVGVMAHNAILRDFATWSTGVFVGTDDFGTDPNNDEISWTSRVTWLPRYEDEGEHVIHFGVSVSSRWLGPDGIRFQARPESQLIGNTVDTGTLMGDNVYTVGFEGALVEGPFSLQGEFVGSHVNLDGGSANLHGAYVSGSYFITGEHRPYDRQSAVFGAVTPNYPWSFDVDAGAVEIVARVSHADLQDGMALGGDQLNLTVGTTWYLDQNKRLMFNFVDSHNDIADLQLYLVRASLQF